MMCRVPVLASIIELWGAGVEFVMIDGVKEMGLYGMRELGRLLVLVFVIIVIMNMLKWRR
jgi:hypothetical protein